jgi:Retron-type reverse transcriptase
MSSLELQVSSGLATIAWHSINWAACHRRVRSLQRRIVQAVQAGLWRKVKRLSYLLVRSLAGRALAIKRVTENAGKKTPGVDGKVWDTPEQKADAITRIGQWRNYQSRPLKRIYIPKRIGLRRPLSIPALIDRARQALHLQALQPIGETQADPNSYGFRPKRQCADAIDQCFKVLRLKSSANWILEADIEGFFDHISVAWMETHIPMNRRVLSKWLSSGFLEQGRRSPTSSGVPQGGIISPVISNLGLEGLEAVVHGSPWQRRVHNINFIRWADDFIVTANSREVLEQTVLPRINAFLGERGVRLSPTKTVITPLSEGFDFLGHRSVSLNGATANRPSYLSRRVSSAYTPSKLRSEPSANKPKAPPPGNSSTSSTQSLEGGRTTTAT